jgi:hypothetical protein
MMAKFTADYWIEQSKSVRSSENPLRIPFHVYLDEALSVAKFVKDRYQPKNNLPGLQRVSARVSLDLIEEITTLVETIQSLQVQYLLLADPVVADLGARARLVIDELESALSYLLDDGVEEIADHQLSNLRDAKSQDGERSSSLAQYLQGYGTLAKQLKDRLVVLDAEFEVGLIDEALELSKTVRERVVTEESDSVEAKEKIATRNRLLRLLHEKVQKVRDAAAYVFKRHPEIIRDATSAYERQRRNAAKKALAERAKATPSFSDVV